MPIVSGLMSRHQKPWTYPQIVKDAALSAGTDVVYRTCYRLLPRVRQRPVQAIGPERQGDQALERRSATLD